MRIGIRNYRSIERLDLQLGPITLLIGANGAGKSNFLSIFQLLQAIQNEAVPAFLERVGEKNLFFAGASGSLFAHIEVGFTEERWFDILWEQKKTAELYFEVGVKSEEEEHGYGNVLTFKKSISGGYSAEPNRSSVFEEWEKVIHSSKIVYYQAPGPLAAPQRADAPAVGEEPLPYGLPGASLAGTLARLREKAPKSYRLILATIQSVAPFIADFDFAEQTSIPPTELRWRSTSGDLVFSERTLSEATRHFIALAVLLLQPELPHLIALDGPETGLHPWAIGKLAGLIRSAGARGGQVVVATQSTDLLSHFQPEEVITVDQKAGASVFTRLDAEQLAGWLEDYSLDDLWKRHIISTGQP